MFGADNCRASVPQPAAQFRIAGGLAQGSAYQTAHLATAALKIFHYTLFKMDPNTQHCQKTVGSIFLVTLFEVRFFKELFFL